VVDHPRLLVVDDDEAILHGCRRIFSRQGYEVETIDNARAGLSLATSDDYAAILLDIEMPTMSGVEFLGQLRGRKPDLPVIFITGYPSVSSAALAVRLGASDYITKPFTPEEITQALQQSLGNRALNGKKRSPAGPSGAAQAGPWAAASGGPRFLDESWFQSGNDGTVRVGVMLGKPVDSAIEAIRLPRIGEAVYRGLPLAGLTVQGRQRILPSPVSGVVVEVNSAPERSPSMLWEDPFGRGWLASIHPTRLEEDTDYCKPRPLRLANADEASGAAQAEALTLLGCRAEVISRWAPTPALPDDEPCVLLVDAASFGPRGPELVAWVNDDEPSTRVVVIAPATSPHEAAYRQRKIFYYAVEPFADKEIIEVLNAAFRPRRVPSARARQSKTASDSLGIISTTNRNGKKVSLLAARGLMSRKEGVGRRVSEQLTGRLFPMKTMPGKEVISQASLLAAASACDRLLVLVVKEMGRLSGSLACKRGEFFSLPAETARKVTALLVQPAIPGGGLNSLDDRTTAALAEHILAEITTT